MDEKKKLAKFLKTIHQKEDRLKPPSMRRIELQKTKHLMGKLSSIEHEIGSLTKKHRLLNSMYKSGVTGVDDPCDPNSFLYKDKSLSLMKESMMKKVHNEKRQECKCRLTCRAGLSESHQ